MLTNNSVDLRVYEVIEEKPNNIIDQLGIYKTSDVLDSAIIAKLVYIESYKANQKLETISEYENRHPYFLFIGGS
jgi:hypothetical protein